MICIPFVRRLPAAACFLLLLGTAAPVQLLPNRVAAGDATMSFAVLRARASAGRRCFPFRRDAAVVPSGRGMRGK